jgi:hypothetical protein
MANAIPLLEGTNASGGFLVPDGDRRHRLQPRSQPRVGDRVDARPAHPPGHGKREKLTEYVGRPTVATVAEGAAKPATGAEYAQVTLDIVKAATVIMYTEELIEDAVEDPTVLINNDVRAAFADYVDRTRSAATRRARSSARSTRSCRRRRRPSSSAPRATRSRRPCRRRWRSSRRTATSRTA